MNPRSAASFLRSIASGIDTSERPSLSVVASYVRGLIIAIETGGEIDANFAAAFDQAFDSIDRMSGDQNMVLLFDIRQKMFGRDPELADKFDEQVLKMGNIKPPIIELSEYNKLSDGKLPLNYIKGGIKEGGKTWVWVSKVTGETQPKDMPFSPHEFDSDVPLGA